MFDTIIPDYDHLNFVCDQEHDDWWEYIWSTEHVDSLHNSYHMFDPYSFVHILNAGILFLLLTYLIDIKDIAAIISILAVILFELKENQVQGIIKYGIASGNFSNSNIVIPSNNPEKPYVYEKDGKTYNFVRKDDKIFMIDKNHNIIKEINLQDLGEYGLSIYRGDSIVNILGDVVTGIIGIFVVYYLLDTEDSAINITIYFVMLFLFIISMLPILIHETIRFVSLNLQDT
jgi:hypothetical protein